MAIDAVTSEVVAATTGAVAGPKVAQQSQADAVVTKMTATQPTRFELHGAVHAAVNQIDSYLRSVGREVEFHVDDATGRTVVTVRVSATGELIRQIPNEEVLQLARRIESGSHALLDLTV